MRNWGAETAVILGSGLSGIVPEGNESLAYSEFSELPRTSVPGHAGRFVLGKIDIGAGGSRATKTGGPGSRPGWSAVDEPGGESINVPVIFAQGRVHLYEGFSAKDVTAGVRLLAEVGIKQLIITNAAGSLNPKFAAGSWMMITDHINLTGTSPLVGTSRCDVQDAAAQRPYHAPEFVDLSEAYSPQLRKRFADAARKIDMALHEGVYAALLGPQYETPAEVRMLQKLGADAVGMSTVMEVIQARALGLEVVGFSCLTNLAAGISRAKLSHDEVLATGKNAAQDFARLIQAALSI